MWPGCLLEYTADPPKEKLKFVNNFLSLDDLPENC